MQTVQIKILETVYTPQDLESAAAYGEKGFIHVMNLDDDEHYAFSKEKLFGEDIYEKLTEIIKERYSIGDTFIVDDVKYEIV